MKWLLIRNMTLAWSYQYEVAACNGNAPLETGCYHSELFLKLLMNKPVVDCF